MASITSGIQSTGGRNEQGDIENLIGTLLGRGFSQAQTQRALLQAQAPQHSQELARSQEALDVGRREVARPLIVKGSKLDAAAQWARVNAARAGAGTIGAQFRLDEAMRRAPQNYSRGGEVSVTVPQKYASLGFSNPGRDIYTTGASSFYKRGTSSSPVGVAGALGNESWGRRYNPAVTVQQTMDRRLDAVDTWRRNVATQRIAQLNAQAEAEAQAAKANAYGSVVKAINNPQLLTADVQQIAKLLGVKLNDAPGTKLGRG